MGVRGQLHAWAFGEDGPHPPGAFTFEANLKGMFFVCPCGCGAEGFLPFRSEGLGRPSWEWNGNRESPTLAPSVRQLNCGWHGWLRSGNWEPC